MKNRKRKIIIGVLVFLLIIIFFPKSCGRWTTSASLMMNKDCYGLKANSIVIFINNTGGGEYFCFGIPDYSEKEPNFSCAKAEDCIAACGWRATHGGVPYGQDGCVAVNKNSEEYLSANKLEINDKVSILCQKNHCAFKVGIENPFNDLIEEHIIGFREGANWHIEPFFLTPGELYNSPCPKTLIHIIE